ncbi:hypothetical protein [Streptomyces echinatus]|uniref:hypothetical protein n=1 Tax=Streptomyces echinatus TaxID=67293 RepID=UPI0037F953EE
MATVFGRPLDSVHDFSYMRYKILSAVDPTEQLEIETYTGWVQCDVDIAAPTLHFRMKTFLPILPGTVRFYSNDSDDQPGSIVDSTVVASPGAMAPYEDEANVFAVDAADVRLEAQTFGGIAGSPLCLVLKARLSLLNCHMYNYTYSVQVITKKEPQVKTAGIPTNQLPAGGANPEGEPPH